MDRRIALRMILGVGTVAAAGSLLASQAQALPGAVSMPDMTAPTPAVATEEDVAAARVQNVWHWGRPHRGRVVFVRPSGVVIVRPRRRGCWINRFGERVCRF